MYICVHVQLYLSLTFNIYKCKYIYDSYMLLYTWKIKLSSEEVEAIYGPIIVQKSASLPHTCQDYGRYFLIFAELTGENTTQVLICIAFMLHERAIFQMFSISLCLYPFFVFLLDSWCLYDVTLCEMCGKCFSQFHFCLFVYGITFHV